MALNKIIVVKETDNKISVGLPVTQETLDSVTDRGNTTTNSITVSGLTVNSNINASGISASGITATVANIATINNSVAFIGNQISASSGSINQVNATGVSTDNLVFVNGTGTTAEIDNLTCGAIQSLSFNANTAVITSINASSVVASSVASNIIAPSSGSSVSVQSALAVGSSGTLLINNDGSVQVGSTSNDSFVSNPLIEISNSYGFNNLVPSLRLRNTDTNITSNEPIGYLDFYSNDFGNSGVKARIGAFATDTTPDGYLTFNTQGGGGTSGPSERMRIDSSGNVGIGTIPSSRLHVSGNALIDGSVSATTINGVTVSSTSLLAVSATATTINASSATVNSVSGTSFTGASGSFTSINASGLSSTSGTFSLVSSSLISASSGVSASGTSVFSGPVGIGIGLPTAALHVTGSAIIGGDINTNGNVTINKGNPRLRLRDTSGGGHSDGFDLHVSTARFLIDDNTHNLNVLDFDFDAPSSGHTLTMESNKFVVATAPNGNYSPSSRVVIDGSGNVAIGVSGTTHRLHVSGSLRFDGQDTSTPAADTTVVNAWLSININGTNYKMPLYV